MNNTKWLLFCIPVLLIFLGISVAKADSNEKDYDFTVSPSKSLFNITNFKPGDWAERELTLDNNGTKDLQYEIKMKHPSGEDRLFRQLLLKVENGSQVLFDGKLKDFKGVDAQQLKSGAQDNIKFTVKMPEELGNEYQGTTTQFDLLIYVDGDLTGIVGNGFSGGRLPNTGLNDPFYFLLAGTGLITAGTFLLLFKKLKGARVQG